MQFSTMVLSAIIAAAACLLAAPADSYRQLLPRHSQGRPISTGLSQLTDFFGKIAEKAGVTVVQHDKGDWAHILSGLDGGEVIGVTGNSKVIEPYSIDGSLQIGGSVIPVDGVSGSTSPYVVIGGTGSSSSSSFGSGIIVTSGNLDRNGFLKGSWGYTPLSSGSIPSYIGTGRVVVIGSNGQHHSAAMPVVRPVVPTIVWDGTEISKGVQRLTVLNILQANLINTLSYLLQTSPITTNPQILDIVQTLYNRLFLRQINVDFLLPQLEQLINLPLQQQLQVVLQSLVSVVEPSFGPQLQQLINYLQQPNVFRLIFTFNIPTITGGIDQSWVLPWVIERPPYTPGDPNSSLNEILRRLLAQISNSSTLEAIKYNIYLLLTNLPLVLDLKLVLTIRNLAPVLYAMKDEIWKLIVEQLPNIPLKSVYGALRAFLQIVANIPGVPQQIVTTIVTIIPLIPNTVTPAPPLPQPNPFPIPQILPGTPYPIPPPQPTYPQPPQPQPGPSYPIPPQPPQPQPGPSYPVPPQPQPPQPPLYPLPPQPTYPQPEPPQPQPGPSYPVPYPVPSQPQPTYPPQPNPVTPSGFPDSNSVIIVITNFPVGNIFEPPSPGQLHKPSELLPECSGYQGCSIIETIRYLFSTQSIVNYILNLGVNVSSYPNKASLLLYILENLLSGVELQADAVTAIQYYIQYLTTILNPGNQTETIPNPPPSQPDTGILPECDNNSLYCFIQRQINIIFQNPAISRIIQGYNPEVYETKEQYLQVILETLITNNLISLNDMAYVELYLQYLKQQQQSVVYPPIALIDILKQFFQPRDIKELQSFQVLVSWLSKLNLAEILSSYKVGSVRTAGGFLELIFKYALAHPQLSKDQQLYKVIQYFSSKIPTISEGISLDGLLNAFGVITSGGKIVTSQHVYTQTIDMNAVLRAVDRDRLGEKGEKQLIEFFAREFNANVLSKGFEFWKYNTKGSWLKALITYLLNNTNVNPSSRDLLLRVLPLIRTTGIGAEPLEYVN